MSEQAAWAKLASVDTVAGAIEWSEAACVYLEQRPEAALNERERRHGIRLDRYTPALPIDGWPRGRIFDARHELKWERLGQLFQIVYCGEQPPPGLTPEPLGAVTVTTERYFAWGLRVESKDYEMLGIEPAGNAYIEFQIPRLLRYPVSETARRIRIELRACYAADGRLCYARWCGLSEEPTP